MGSLGMISGGYGRKRRSVDDGTPDTNGDAVDDVVDETGIEEADERLEQCISACAESADQFKMSTTELMKTRLSL